MTWKPDKWDTGDCHNIAEDCSWAEKYGGSIIYISPEVWAVIRRLCKEVKTEWQMMLCGEIQADSSIHINGYWIPKQEVTASTVTNLDIIDSAVIQERNIIATVHSHANMSVFFSTTDEQFTNLSLIKNHIVVNNKGESCATTRHTLACGLSRFFDCSVEIEVPEAEVVGKDNIAEKTYTYTPTYDHKDWDTDKRKMRSNKKNKHAILDEEQEYLFQNGMMQGGHL